MNIKLGYYYYHVKNEGNKLENIKERIQKKKLWCIVIRIVLKGKKEDSCIIFSRNIKKEKKLFMYLEFSNKN